jgi:ornithine decarboxylase
MGTVMCGRPLRRKGKEIWLGERLDERAKLMIDYLKVFQESANRFPGFDNEFQGLYRETDAKGVIRYFTHVVRE